MMQSLIWILLLLPGSTPVVADDAPWGWATLSETEWGKSEFRGIILYTTAADSTGAGFRCQNGQIYAFLAVNDVTIREVMLKPSRKAKRWRLKITIGEHEQRDEIWASILGGDLLMARSRTTARELFAAAKDGTTVRIVPKFGDEITIEIPADTRGVFDWFKERCETRT